MNRKGIVSVQNTPAGVIEELDDGFRFTYLESFRALSDAVSVSLTLPLREEPYLSRMMFPFFDGLIPEGWLLSITEKNWKINRHDRMGLLLSVCGDCIGDVSVRIYAEER